MERDGYVKYIQKIDKAQNGEYINLNLFLDKNWGVLYRNVDFQFPQKYGCT